MNRKITPESCAAALEAAPAAVTRLEHWLTNDPEARLWVQLKLQNHPIALALEDIRWSLTNEVLKPELDPKTRDLTKIAPERLVLLARLAAATIVFDIANACGYMKLEHLTPDCPAGFMWIGDEDLAKIPQAEVPRFRETLQRASITGAYGRLAKLHPPVATYIEAMSQPRAPAWMQYPFVAVF